MVFRTRRRTSIGESKGNTPIGFRSKARLRAEGYMRGRWEFITNEGRKVIETGFSKVGVVASNWRVLTEDTRLNAMSKVLYREGYFVDRENYERLDQDKIKRARLLDYNFYYTQNQFMNFSRFRNRRNQVVVVERDSRGRFASRKIEDESQEKKEIKENANI